jgi:hypothetical protein
MNQANCQLILNTVDLPYNSSNSLGSSNADFTTYTWNGINFRTLLGDMYDKYDTFNLCLNCITSSVALSTLGTDITGDLNVYFKISGIPFINQSYSTLTGNNTNSSYLMAYTFVRSQGQIQNYNGNIVKTFSKYQDVSDITITMYRNVDNGIPTTPINTNYPELIFHFSIYGVDKVTANLSDDRRMLH